MTPRLTLKEVGVKFLSTTFGLAVVVLLIMWGMNAQQKRDEKFPWRGSFQTVREEARTTVASDEFKTLEACRSWANQKSQDMDLQTGEWAFECGTNCTWKDDTIVGGKRINTYECTEVVTE